MRGRPRPGPASGGGSSSTTTSGRTRAWAIARQRDFTWHEQPYDQKREGKQEESCGNDRADGKRGKPKRRPSRVSHSSLEISPTTRDFHIPTASTTACPHRTGNQTDRPILNLSKAKNGLDKGGHFPPWRRRCRSG